MIVRDGQMTPQNGGNHAIVSSIAGLKSWAGGPVKILATVFR